MDFEKLENLIESLPDVIKVKLFGRIVDAKLEEYGQQVNGNYIVLETVSPEGYQVKFSIFDEDIIKVLAPPVWFAVIAIETGENNRNMAISKHDYQRDAIKAAERYDRPKSHSYKHIEVWKIPIFSQAAVNVKIVIWRDGLKLSS